MVQNVRRKLSWLNFQSLARVAANCRCSRGQAYHVNVSIQYATSHSPYTSSARSGLIRQRQSIVGPVRSNLRRRETWNGRLSIPIQMQIRNCQSQIQ